MSARAFANVEPGELPRLVHFYAVRRELALNPPSALRAFAGGLALGVVCTLFAVLVWSLLS